MTLKEKIENIDIVAYDSIDGEYYSHLNQEEIEEIIKIADEFAIGFAEWCGVPVVDANVEELLEIYKKELEKL